MYCDGCVCSFIFFLMTTENCNYLHMHLSLIQELNENKCELKTWLHVKIGAFYRFCNFSAVLVKIWKLQTQLGIFFPQFPQKCQIRTGPDLWCRI